MKKNNKGFTLIEMLVCVGIIAALGVIIGLSATTVINNTKYAKYEAQMKDIFTAASVYIELSKNSAIKNGCKSSGCIIKLSSLVTEGLVDKSIYNETNPLLLSGANYNDDVEITVKWSSGIKDVSYCEIKLSTIDDTPEDKWGNCTE